MILDFIPDLSSISNANGNDTYEVIKMENQQKKHYVKHDKKERPISKAFPLVDNDLGRDNSENDMTAADLQDI